MKKILRINTFLIVVYILISCNQKKNNLKSESNQLSDSISNIVESSYESIHEKERQDTIYNYWQPNFDTIKITKEFKNFDKQHILELSTFSLNDSAIVRKLDQFYIDYSHTIVTDIKIINEEFIIERRIDKTTFKNYLIPEFYKECNLFYTEYDSIIENQLHLTSVLSIPDTDNQWQVKYCFSLNMDVDSLKVKDVSYIGN